MDKKIEIRDNNTNESGTYKVWYYNPTMGGKCAKVLSEQQVNSLLNMRQKEDFFMGADTFTIESEYDFKATFLTADSFSL